MTYQQAVFGNDEFYHVVNRGVEKRLTFLDKRDYQRFLQTLEYYRFKNPPTRFSFKNRPNILKKGSSNEVLIEVICFCLMPNHFHLLLKQAKENGISVFLSKLTNSYTKYFNTRHKRVGPLFQGSFKAVRIEDDEQLVHTSRYIHLNPLIDYLVKNLRVYQYSSYRQFLDLEDGFCKIHYVLDRFPSPGAYEKFVLDQEEYGRTIKKIERLLLED
ncbi:transposase [Candidatus Daviesbacteria bacterium]|nr:transposase [Candidatus Daviesbacteria bacterium]